MKRKASGCFAALVILSTGHLLSPAAAQATIDAVTGFQRNPAHVAAWPGGKKVAVSFALFVEAFGFGQGPVFRPDLASRNPRSRERGFPRIRNPLGHCASRAAVQGVGGSAQRRAERGISTEISLGLEGVPRDAAEGADHRAWHQQHQPAAAARSRSRRAEGLYPSYVGCDRRRDRREARRMVEPKRLFEWRHDAGHSRRGHYLYPRPDGF